ncbi:hypothetical protein ABZR71_08000 [Pseudomonas paraeruginosa]|uniref:hypothetical protein n=1 Tax=Pseudomonas aeruginosa group TaxID=136841 RepID=UPI0011B25BE8|nr:MULTISPECIES: hypothetical protein [Pseudomonas aeruginosa group]
MDELQDGKDRHADEEEITDGTAQERQLSAPMLRDTGTGEIGRIRTPRMAAVPALFGLWPSSDTAVHQLTASPATTQRLAVPQGGIVWRFAAFFHRPADASRVTAESSEGVLRHRYAGDQRVLPRRRLTERGEASFRWRERFIPTSVENTADAHEQTVLFRFFLSTRGTPVPYPTVFKKKKNSGPNATEPSRPRQ